MTATGGDRAADSIIGTRDVEHIYGGYPLASPFGRGGRIETNGFWLSAERASAGAVRRALRETAHAITNPRLVSLIYHDISGSEKIIAQRRRPRRDVYCSREEHGYRQLRPTQRHDFYYSASAGLFKIPEEQRHYPKENNAMTK